MLISYMERKWTKTSLIKWKTPNTKNEKKCVSSIWVIQARWFSKTWNRIFSLETINLRVFTQWCDKDILSNYTKSWIGFLNSVCDSSRRLWIWCNFTPSENELCQTKHWLLGHPRTCSCSWLEMASGCLIIPYIDTGVTSPCCFFFPHKFYVLLI